MFYVYGKHLDTGKETYIASYNTAEEAVHKIAQCYQIDAKTCQEDENYYFVSNPIAKARGLLG